MYCFHYTTCTKPGKWAVMWFVTITLPVQRQVNERSCVLLPLHYLYKDRTMSGRVYCYHYTTCTKPGQWAVICIVTITLPVQNEDNEWSCVLLPLHYLYKTRTMSGHVYCYHYTTCAKPGQWAAMVFCPLVMEYGAPFPWYIDPPLPMVFWPPAYLLIRDEGVKIPWGFNLPYRGVCFQ